MSIWPSKANIYRRTIKSVEKQAEDLHEMIEQLEKELKKLCLVLAVFSLTAVVQFDCNRV